MKTLRLFLLLALVICIPGCTSGETSATTKSKTSSSSAHSSVLENMDIYKDVMKDVEESLQEADVEFWHLYNESEKKLYLILRPSEDVCKAYKSSDPRFADALEERINKLKKISELVSELLPKEYVKTIVIMETDKPLDNKGYDLENCLLLIYDGDVLVNAYQGNADQNSYGSSSKTPYTANTSKAPVSSSGERNALRKAKEYLSIMPFSASGLKDQLEYEGFSSSEAQYAVDNCGADWNEQAVKKAEDYLDMMSFSRAGLIEQLEYEGFTHSQAEYGVNQAY